MSWPCLRSLKRWKRTGCTIITDGLSDRKRHSICNFLVNSPKGAVFSSFVDTSNISKTTGKVFDMLDALVEKVGLENVVRVVRIMLLTTKHQ